MTPSSTRPRRLRHRLPLIAAGLLTGLFILEAALRILNPYPLYTMLPANARWEFLPKPGVLPGINGFSLYTTNAVGIRGDEYQADGRYNILAIGGSTTETTYLDDSESWTHLLQNELNQENGRLPGLDPDMSVWVGNVGRSGHGLVEHIHALQYFVPQYRFDAVIILAGINDFIPFIQQPEQYHSGYEDPANYFFYLHRSFYTFPLVDPRLARPFPQNTAVWNLAYFKAWNLLGRIPRQIVVEQADGQSYEVRRENYLDAPLLAELPELTPALLQYEENLRRLAALAQAQQIRLIFVTQPAIWHENLSPEMARQLWLGVRGDLEKPDGRYELPDLRAGLARFNELMLQVCREQPVECVDLAAAMTGQETYFYDDAHFNEAGGKQVAHQLAQYLNR